MDEYEGKPYFVNKTGGFRGYYGQLRMRLYCFFELADYTDFNGKNRFLRKEQF